jgi:hypothetical protein
MGRTSEKWRGFNGWRIRVMQHLQMYNDSGGHKRSAMVVWPESRDEAIKLGWCSPTPASYGSLELISHGIMLFSLNKLANSSFQSNFSAKRTGLSATSLSPSLLTLQFPIQIILSPPLSPISQCPTIPAHLAASVLHACLKKSSLGITVQSRAKGRLY